MRRMTRIVDLIASAADALFQPASCGRSPHDFIGDHTNQNHSPDDCCFVLLRKFQERNQVVQNLHDRSTDHNSQN